MLEEVYKAKTATKAAMANPAIEPSALEAAPVKVDRAPEEVAVALPVESLVVPNENPPLEVPVEDSPVAETADPVAVAVAWTVLPEPAETTVVPLPPEVAVVVLAPVAVPFLVEVAVELWEEVEV